MKTIWTTMGAVALIALLTLSTANAQEATAPAAAPPAAAETPTPPDAAADGSKDFELTVEGRESEGDGGGLRITIGDDDEAEVAAKVVDRVVKRLERSLAGLPADVRRDIGAEDMEELRTALADLRAARTGGFRSVDVDHDSDTGELIGALAVLLLFGGPVLIVAIVSFNNRRKRQMVHETIDRIISQGKDVPVELLDALDKGRNGKSMLQRGVINIAIGIGVGGMLLGFGAEEAASLGLIWLCIGLAQLLVWRLEKPRDGGATVS